MGRIGGDGDSRVMRKGAPQTNLSSHISTPLYPNDSSLIQFVCYSSEGVSYVTVIMRNCVVGCFRNVHNHTFISSDWKVITDVYM